MQGLFSGTYVKKNNLQHVKVHLHWEKFDTFSNDLIHRSSFKAFASYFGSKSS